MENLPFDNKGQPGLPKQLLHWDVLGQMTSVEFQPLVRTEEQPCQAFPRNNREKNHSVVFCQNGNSKTYFKHKSIEEDVTVSRIRV